MLVAGVDVWKGTWVAVALDDGTLAAVVTDPSLASLADRLGEAAVIAVDIPVGLPVRGRRRADEAVRPFVGPRRSSVFFAPPRDVLAEPTYQAALATCRARHGFGISAQAYALRERVLEADAVAARDARVAEVHPEASFRAMAGEPLAFAKRTWNGQMARRRLLSDAGIEIPDDLADHGAVPPDDILDAAAAAWSAHRIARGSASSLPDPPERIAGRDVAIWF